MHIRLAFVTQYRREVFNDEMLTRCEEIMRKVGENFEEDLKGFNGGPISPPPGALPARVGVSKLVNDLKGVSTSVS